MKQREVKPPRLSAHDDSPTYVNATHHRGLHPYAQAVTSATDEDQYLRRTLALLNGARPYEDLIRSTSQEWEVQPGSSLAGDDAKTNPYQASHNAWSALSVAVDHLHCFRSTLVGEQKGNELPITLHTHGQYSLLRGGVREQCAGRMDAGANQTPHTRAAPALSTSQRVPALGPPARSPATATEANDG